MSDFRGSGLEAFGTVIVVAAATVWLGTFFVGRWAGKKVCERRR